MKVSRNGQVSLPAEARTRWRTQQVIVVDLGDRVVMRPLPEDPIDDLVGKYRTGPETDTARRRARADDANAAKSQRR